MVMRLGKSGPQRPTHPDITFISQGDVMTHARLLAEHRGKQRFEHFWPALENGLRIFDRYALASKLHRRLPPQAAIGQSWVDLAQEPTVQDICAKTLVTGDGQSRFGEIQYDLAIMSVDIPNRGAPGSVMQGTRARGKYRLDQLTAVEFAEMCWQVRSNLEHGGYDLQDAQTQALLMKFAHPLSHITWQMVSRTRA
jgi:hypothetical protein